MEQRSQALETLMSWLDRQTGALSDALPRLVAELAGHRLALESARSGIREQRARLEADPVYRACCDQADEAEVSEMLVYRQLVKIAEHLCRVTGDKHPHTAVTVKETQDLQYDAVEAGSWIRQNLPQAVKVSIDWKMFEQHARAIQKTAPLGFVTFQPGVKASVAKDLAGYLPGQTAQEINP
ncbi:MAG: hypothetical protein ACKOC5_12055 [Chloroflexota bacterium]